MHAVATVYLISALLGIIMAGGVYIALLRSDLKDANDDLRYRLRILDQIRDDLAATRAREVEKNAEIQKLKEERVGRILDEILKDLDDGDGFSKFKVN